MVGAGAHQRVLDRVNAEVERLRAHGFASWELEHARAVVVYDSRRRRSAEIWQEPVARADRIVDEVSWGGSPLDWARWTHGVEMFVQDVSADEVRAAVLADLPADRRVYAALGTPTIAAPSVPSDLPGPPTPPAAAPVSEPGPALEGAFHASLGVTTWRLPSGTTVLYKQMAPEDITGFLWTLWSRADPGREWSYVRDVASRAFALGDSDRALSAAGASLDLRFDEEHAIIEGYAPERNGLEVTLAEAARRVSAPPAAPVVAKARGALDGPISSEDRFAVAFTEAVFGAGAADARTADTLAGVTTERVASLWADALGTSGDDVLTIVGSAPPEDVGPIVASTLSGLSSTTAPPHQPAPGLRTAGGSWSILANGPFADRVTVRMWVGAEQPEVPIDAFDLTGLAGVVQSVLTDKLREELHLTYDVSVLTRPPPGPCGIVAEWTTSTDRAQESLEAAMKELARLREEEVEPATSRGVQAWVDAAFEEDMRDPRWWTNNLSERVLAGELPAVMTPERPRVAPTPTRIHVVAKAVLRLEDVVVVSQRPRRDGAETAP